jgi:sterol desaturase/sphingolipid hydroxylase (fatty acid hydroxylase superfamily)
MDRLLGNGSEVYAVVYFGMIAAVALAEWLQPRRVPGEGQGLRWVGNFGLTILGAILVRAVFPLVGVGWAVFCEEHRLGLLNQVAWPFWLTLAATIVTIDLAYYLQHYLLHRVPLLWRLHRTHHSDVEYDFTTGVRFHPFETVYSTAVLMLVVLVLGAPPVAVLLSQALSVALAFVEHANLRIPEPVDRVVRRVFVTPDMHRIHHSQEIDEGNSNFSNMFSFWDRLFGTYIDQPAAGHDGIAFGVAELSGVRHQQLPWMLAQPFLNPARPADPTRPDLNATSPSSPRTGH